MQRNGRRRSHTFLIARAMRCALFIALLEIVSAAYLQCQAPRTEPRPLDKPEAVQSASESKEPEDAQRKQIIADTERLYQLAVELRAEVAKTHKETLSLAVLKKAKEVEAMARSLKVSMSHPEKPSKK